VLPQPLFELEGDWVSVLPPDELLLPDPETALLPLEAGEPLLLLPFAAPSGPPPPPLDEALVLPAPLDPPEELELLDPVAPLEELEPIPPPPDPLASGASTDESTSPDFPGAESSTVESTADASELPPNVMSAQWW